MTPVISPPSALVDHHFRGRVADFLKNHIRPGARLSVVSAYFSIYAYDALKTALDGIEHLDFLFGEPRFLTALDPEGADSKAFLLDASSLTLARRLEQKRIARDCADWIRDKVSIRSVRHGRLLHGKLYHIANGPVEEALLGSSNFTVAGLPTADETPLADEQPQENKTAFELVTWLVILDGDMD